MITISTYPTGAALTAERSIWFDADGSEVAGFIVRQGDREVWLSDDELSALTEIEVTR